ncbi:MAG: tetratricopeptide repeat protein, partial [Pirellulaceae bacterium]|nr:tetratricopeptide repeat protein [Pirellulaceae bacterium]
MADPGATIAQPFVERPGTQIGPYKVLQQIGEGGMGVVYMAEQLEPVKRRVALKIIKPGMDSRQVIARFEAERQALSLMDHPNIAKVLDAGTTESGRPYFAMERVKGQPITQYCDEHHQTPRQRLELLLPVCQAIQHAHQKGIIHRDIKPTNILVAEYDQKAVPKVIDFGVAKATSQTLTEKTMFTGFGQIVGTLEYMSPEQAKVNQLDIDTRSDIYSLGVLLYELLTGSTPFDKERLRSAGWDEMLRIIREEEPPKPSTRLSESSRHAPHSSPLALREEIVMRSVTPTLASIAAVRGTEPARLPKLVRGELDWIVMKALEKDRNRRYESASGLAADLERYLNDDPVQACPPSAGYRLRKFARRNSGRLAAAGVLGIALLVACGAVAGSVGWAWRDRVARQATIVAKVSQFLDESEALYRQRKLPEAIQHTHNALALAEGSVVDLEEVRRAREWLKDLNMVAQIDEVGGGDIRPAFREYGIDIEALNPEEAAARIAARPIRVDLAVALDRWHNTVRRMGVNPVKGLEGEKGVAHRDRLRQIARLADPDEVRNRLRDLYANAAFGPEAGQELIAIADSIDLASTPIGTLMALGDTLDQDHRVSFYARLQQQHPSDFAVANQLGGLHFWHGDMDRAIRYFTAAVAIRPQSAGARQFLAHALGNKGDVDEAIDAYRAADRLNGQPTNQPYIGALLLESGREQEAAAEFREALRLGSSPLGPAGVHAEMGRAYVRVGKYDDAIAAYREAIRFKADYAHPHDRLGYLLAEKKGLMDEAIAAQREAVRLVPKHSDYHNNLGLTLSKAGRVDEAIAAFREATKLDPSASAYHFNLGHNLTKTKDSDAAIDALRIAIRLDPKSASAHHVLGIALMQKGNMDEAIAAYGEAVRLKPDDPDYRRGLGSVLRDRGLHIEAIGAYSEAVRLAPNGADPHVGLGRALQKKGLLDDAIREHREAVRLNPSYAIAHHWLGTALDEKGLLDDAIAAQREAIRLEPDSASYRWWLGKALLKKGLLDDAIEEFQVAIGLRPDMIVAHRFLGIALEKKGLLDDAIAARRELIRLRPDNANEHGDLGGLHARHGQWEPAAAAYARCFELAKNPNNPFVWYVALPLHLAAGDQVRYQ